MTADRSDQDAFATDPANVFLCAGVDVATGGDAALPARRTVGAPAGARPRDAGPSNIAPVNNRMTGSLRPRGGSACQLERSQTVPRL